VTLTRKRRRAGCKGEKGPSRYCTRKPVCVQVGGDIKRTNSRVPCTPPADTLAGKGDYDETERKEIKGIVDVKAVRRRGHLAY